LLYGGQYQDAESGMYYLRARYYDPSTGQFISRDPLVSTTRQAYAYVADNPLNGADPTGLDFWGDVQNAVIGTAKHLPQPLQQAIGAGAAGAAQWVDQEHAGAAWIGQNGGNIATACSVAAVGGGEALAPILGGCAAVAGAAAAAYEYSSGKPLEAAWDGTWAAVGLTWEKNLAVGCAGLAADAGKRLYDWGRTAPQNPTRHDAPDHPGLDF
jgi:RHS repeat-associated protein